MKDCEITKMGLFDIQVCSVLTEDETLAWVQKECPSGTERNWLQRDGETGLKPTKCADHPGRTHYIFSC